MGDGLKTRPAQARRMKTQDPRNAIKSAAGAERQRGPLQAVCDRIARCVLILRKKALESLCNVHDKVGMAVAAAASSGLSPVCCTGYAGPHKKP